MYVCMYLVYVLCVHLCIGSSIIYMYMHLKCYPIAVLSKMAICFAVLKSF